MNPSQQRAWLALDIGPIWRLRRPLGPVRSGADVQAFIGEAVVEERVAEDKVAEASVQDFFLLPDATGRWLFIGALSMDVRVDEQAGAEPMRLLRQMLAATGLQSGEVQHAVAGAGLSGRIEALAPQLIIALGEEAVRLLLKLDTPFASLRTQPHSWRSSTATIPLVATWHPSTLLSMPQRKAQAWEDLCRARTIVQDM